MRNLVSRIRERRAIQYRKQEGDRRLTLENNIKIRIAEMAFRCGLCSSHSGVGCVHLIPVSGYVHFTEEFLQFLPRTILVKNTVDLCNCGISSLAE